MNKAAITHVSYANYAFPVAKDSLCVRLKAARGDLKQVSVIYGPRFIPEEEGGFLQREMELVASDRENDYFETVISLAEGRFRYHFLLTDGIEKYWFNERGFFPNQPRGYNAGFFQYSQICESDLINRPDWLDGAVVYQIFPERFNNGDSSLDPDSCQQWGMKPERDSFFGGDLKGIMEKLDYLAELGVNVIYLTPIFASPSNHKYNIDDYYRIDPHFGDQELARRLVQQAHDRGIKVILDAVFNHSGYDFFAFKDLREKGEASEYRDWYIYDSLPLKTESPVNYKTFARDIPSLPKLNTAYPEVQDYLLAVTAYWMERLEIDGWRLDVADEVDPYFWYRFRRLVKKLNPEAYIVGEVWHGGQKWLQGDHFDGIMNYNFMEACLDFFGRKKIGPVEFAYRLSKNRMNYKKQVMESMLNLLDSHDTARFLYYCDNRVKSLKLALLFQMTYPGVPLILYGDEFGLTGGEEPDSRRCMPWEAEKQNKELYIYYKKLINIRRASVALQKGDFRTLITDEIRNIYGFSRHFQEESFYVLLNNSYQQQTVKLKLDSAAEVMQEIVGGKIDSKYDDKFQIKIGPEQGVILRSGRRIMKNQEIYK